MNKKIFKVFSHMLENGKTTFVDMTSVDDFIYDDLVTASRLDEIGKVEGNGFKAHTGKTIEFQYAAIADGTHKYLYLQTCNGQETKINGCCNIGKLFSGKSIVIVYSGTLLCGFAPIFFNKLELILWLQELDQWFSDLSIQQQWSFSKNLEVMKKMAEFLYDNNPNQIEPEVDNL